MKNSELKIITPIHKNLFEVNFLNESLNKDELNILTQLVKVIKLTSYKTFFIKFDLGIYDENIVPLHYLKNKKFNIELLLHTKEGKVYDKIIFNDCTVSNVDIEYANFDISDYETKDIKIFFTCESTNL